jgi:hypothetical protein
MGLFTQISEETFNEIQTDVGVLLKDFDPEAPELDEASIICATTGGITASCVPTFSDFGADIDNVPNNTMELKRIDGWDTTFAFTALNATAETIKLSLGAADISGISIIPRRTIKPEDFADIWWVGDRSDGGLVAVKLKNALSTGGLSLQTNKNGKGQLSVTLTGHTSIKEQNVVPMEFFVKEGEV